MQFSLRHLAIFGFGIAVVVGVAWYFLFRAPSGTGTADRTRTTAAQPERPASLARVSAGAAA